MTTAPVDAPESSGTFFLRTKLLPPRPAPEILARPRLLERLQANLTLPLTLVTANAGSGKTTLIADFLRKQERPYVWYQLDHTDADPAVFLGYLAYGIQQRVPGFGQTTFAFLQQAQELAREKDLDLVEISPTANPPVCKIMDYGKYVFQQKKKQSEAKKKQKIIVVKEIQFRPRIDEHDFEFKKNNIIRFLQHGDKVKASIRFRGREMSHMELGRAVLDRLLVDIKDYGVPETTNPDVQGNRMTIVIAPNK